MSFDMPRASTATSAPRTANGTARSTASGSDQASNCAARIRKVMMIAKVNANSDALPMRRSWKAWPDQAM